MGKKKFVSKIAKGKMSRAVVMRGSKEKTATGMTKADLTRNKNGKIVSKKQSALAKKRFATTVGPWMKAVKKARAALKLKGFVATKKGSPLTSRPRSSTTSELKCLASSGTSASSR